jgi:hypothetical protein
MQMYGLGVNWKKVNTNSECHWHIVLYATNKDKQINSVALSLQANYTDWATATCRRNLVPTLADRRVSRGQRGGTPTAVSLSFLDRSRYFSFK